MVVLHFFVGGSWGNPLPEAVMNDKPLCVPETIRGVHGRQIICYRKSDQLAGEWRDTEGNVLLGFLSLCVLS